mgnify:FL=1
MFEVFFICFEVTIFFALLRFIVWYYTSVALWILFSPDYLVILIGSGAFVGDHIDLLTSSLAGKIAWAIMAMVVAWAVYFTFNSFLYGVSKRIYRIVSFLLIVGCSLYIMLSLVLRLMEKVGPQLANDSTTNHMVYVCIAVVIALVAWIRRQALMSKLDADDKLVIVRDKR